MDFDLINPFEEGMINVFLLVFEDELIEKKIIETQETFNSLGLSILIGFSGEIKGRILLDMSEKTSKLLAEKMLEKQCSINEEEDNVDFAIYEVANRIGEKAMNIFKSRSKDLNIILTNPSIITGKGMKITNHKLNAKTIFFDSSFGEIYMNIAFEEE